VGWFSKKIRTAAGAVVSDRGARKEELKALRDFATTRHGVEAFLEPATTSTQTTVLLVATDGEWTRRRVVDAKAAAEFASSLQLPLYDANRVGYPQRMREYSAKMAARSRSEHAGSSSARRDHTRISPAQYAALVTLERYAGSGPLRSDSDRDVLLKALRAARANAHPDRHGGDRSSWDSVEQAARTLGLAQ